MFSYTIWKLYACHPPSFMFYLLEMLSFEYTMYQFFVHSDLYPKKTYTHCRSFVLKFKKQIYASYAAAAVGVS